MSKYVVDFANSDKAEVLNLTNNDNTATIQTNLTTDVVDVTNLQALTVEPVDRKVFAEELADATGYNVIGRTEYNSDYSAAAILGIPRESLMAHLTRKVIYGNTFKDVFDDWKRISHLETTEKQPANAAELNNWSYDEDTDAVKCTVNSSTFIALVSNYKIYGDYVFDTIMGSSDGDNDSGIIVLAFVVDEQGKEHTLCAVRSRSVEGHLKVSGKFDIWYNYKQSSRKLIATGGGTENDGVWTNFFSRITATKAGNNFVVECTAFSNNADEAGHGPTAIAVSHRFSLGDHPELQKFVNGAGFGYGAMSQNQLTYANLLRPDQREASAFKEIQTFKTALDGDKYYRIAYLDQVVDEGEATDGSVADTTPSRSHLATLVNKAYVKDTVDVRFNRVNLTDVMEMSYTAHAPEVLCPHSVTDAMSDSPFAEEHTSAEAIKWGDYKHITPHDGYGKEDGYFYVRKWFFFEETGSYDFRFYNDDYGYLWVDNTLIAEGHEIELPFDVTRGWHAITVMCHDTGGRGYVGGAVAKDGTYILNTDESWKVLEVTGNSDYDVSVIPEVNYDLSKCRGDFDWYTPIKDDPFEHATQARTYFGSPVYNWGTFTWITPEGSVHGKGAKFVARKWHYFEAGDHKFRYFADSNMDLWIDETNVSSDDNEFTITQTMTKGWHCITVVAYADASSVYFGGNVTKDGVTVLNTDHQWKCLDVSNDPKYDGSYIPPVVPQEAQLKEPALAAFREAALRQGIDTDKQMRGLDVRFEDRNELGKNVSYMVMTFESYTLNDGAAAEFRMPVHFSDVVSVTHLRGFVYAPIEASAVVK